MTNMEHTLLLKEVRPAELRSWEVKFDSWLSCSFQGTPPTDFYVATFISKCDAWWVNRLLPKKQDNITMGDLRGFVREEMKVLYPVSCRRDILFESKQKGGQSPSEFYLELKDLALDCELDTMGRESLICHLLLRGLHSSKEKLREKIIIDAEGQKLKDSKISGLIATSEMYRSSARKNSSIHRTESKQGAGGSDK